VRRRRKANSQYVRYTNNMKICTNKALKRATFFSPCYGAAIGLHKSESKQVCFLRARGCDSVLHSCYWLTSSATPVPVLSQCTFFTWFINLP
jgi:hypothetical protein